MAAIGSIPRLVPGQEQWPAAVERIDGQWMPEVGHVDADLVESAGGWGALDQRVRGQPFDDPVAGKGFLALFRVDDDTALFAVDEQPGVGLAVGGHEPLDQGKVEFFHGAVFPLLREEPLGLFGSGVHDDAGGARSRRWTTRTGPRSDPIPAAYSRSGRKGASPPSGDREDSGGLVGDDDPRVGVKHEIVGRSGARTHRGDHTAWSVRRQGEWDSRSISAISRRILESRGADAGDEPIDVPCGFRRGSSASASRSVSSRITPANHSASCPLRSRSTRL